jgi:hypothetical protein
MGALELIDAAMPDSGHQHELLPCEYYQAWLAAFDDAEEAWLAWCAAPFRRKQEAATVYRAAVDREDAAAACWLAA